MARKIIDFHMHPWTLPEERICNFPDAVLAGDSLATLAEDMARVGYPDRLIENVFYKNAENFFRAHTDVYTEKII